MEAIHQACALTKSIYLIRHFSPSNTLAETLLDTMQEGNTALGLFSVRDFSLEMQDHPLPSQVQALMKEVRQTMGSPNVHVKSLRKVMCMPEFQMFANPDEFCYTADGTAHSENLQAYAK